MNGDWKCLKNKFLLVMPNVILTARLDEAIVLLDPHFEKFSAIRYVTSGKRNAIMQLATVIEYCQTKNVPVNFVKEDVDVKLGSTGEYIWAEAWSQLLNQGCIINPPREALCKYDHTNCNGVFIKGGTVYEPTKHDQSIVACFDMSDWRGNQTENEKNSVDDEAKIINVAKDLDPAIGIINCVSERNNNCLHTNLKLNL